MDPEVKAKLKTAAAGQLRHLITAGAVYVGMTGFASNDDQINLAVSVLMYAGAIGWSLAQKRGWVPA